MTRDLQSTLSVLARVPGVRAAVLSSEDDGLAAAAVAAMEVDSDALAAFAMSLLRRSRLATEAAGYGRVRFLALDAAGGRVLVAAGRGLALAVLADRDGSVGLVRVEMLRAMREVA